MPRSIGITIKSLKVTLPLKNIDTAQNLLYDDEILTLNLNNFSVTTQYTKQDDAVKFIVNIILNLYRNIHPNLALNVS